MRTLPLIPAILAAAGLAACGGSGSSDGGDPVTEPTPTDYTVERVFSGLSFPGVTDIQAPPAPDARLFVAEKAGRIRVFSRNDPAAGALTFLDLSGRADLVTDGEGGLLGLAFDPAFAGNGYFYVHYTADSPRRIVVARFTDTGVRPVDPATEEVVLEIPHPGTDNHYAGALAFGPVDGMLYLTAGDGGGSYDPDDNAQDRTNLLGSVMRIDVSVTGTGVTPNYAVPSDNPYAGNTAGLREEIYAYGFRNPYRLSIDSDLSGQRIWVADVGQDAREEIDVITAGGNYGWDCREGSLTVDASLRSSACDSLTDSDFTAPLTEYGHDLGESVTGGYVYRGTRLAALTGRYVFGDFISGRIWAYDRGSDERELLVDTGLSISTFGTDDAGNLYIGDYGSGALYRLSP